MENVGSLKLTVTRQGGDVNTTTMYVDYRSEDGTANAGSDYDYAEGTVVFFPGETSKQFAINIIDDDVFEEDEHFFVGLSNVRVDSMQGDISEHKGPAGQPIDRHRYDSGRRSRWNLSLWTTRDDHNRVHLRHPDQTDSILCSQGGCPRPLQDRRRDGQGWGERLLWRGGRASLQKMMKLSKSSLYLILFIVHT